MTAQFPPIEERWQLSDLFPDDAAFEAARREFEVELDTLGRWQGRLAEGGATLADAMEGVTDAYKRLALLRCYASLRSDIDTRDTTCQAMRQAVELLATGLSKRVSYLRPEILTMEPSTVEGFIETETRLAPHAFYLRDLMRQRAHVLGPSEEQILAETGLLTRSPSTLYHVLHNADLPRPEIDLDDGKRVRLTPVGFHESRRSPNRTDRARVFPAYFRAYSDFRETLGQNLYSCIKTHLFNARVRGYDSSLAASLDGDNVPVTVYRNLIERVHEHLPRLHRYFRLRARALGIEKLEYIDLYCPLSPRPPAAYSTADARRMLLGCVGPLGQEYVETLERAFVSRWVDWHPVDGKRAGAYSSGWAYEQHPYVLMNYTSDYESVSTLAHEMGHALHSFFSNRAQPFATADYSIFVAEVASTLNEALLSEQMLHEASTVEEQLFLLGTYLDGIRGTLFRQTMFAEFELEIHERAERGEVLTGDRLSEIYLALLRRYHGHDEGVVWVADDFSVEWAAVPHFYYDFYVYQYATGIVASAALAEGVRGGQPGAGEAYLEFLSSGGSDYPLALLRRAGVDLETAEPYAALMQLLERRLDHLESLLDEKSSS